VSDDMNEDQKRGPDPQTASDKVQWDEKNEREAGNRNNDSSSDRNTGGRERGREK
jgi:hypothetical protein